MTAAGSPVRVAAVMVLRVNVMILMRVSHFIPVGEVSGLRGAAHIFTLEHEYYYGRFRCVDGPLR